MNHYDSKGRVLGIDDRLVLNVGDVMYDSILFNRRIAEKSSGILNRLGYDGPVRAEPFNADLRKMPDEEAVAATARAMKKAFALIR